MAFRCLCSDVVQVRSTANRNDHPAMEADFILSSAALACPLLSLIQPPHTVRMSSFSLDKHIRSSCKGFEAMNRFRKGHIRGMEKGDGMKQVSYNTSWFEVVI
jgi:hypothetical protein